MRVFVAATGDIPQQFLVNSALVLGVLGFVVIGLWLAMLVAAFRRTR
jgi:hypothetical protein